MTSYILKNNEEEREVLLYQEKISYTFIPKKKTFVKKITLLDDEMISSILKQKVIKNYNRLIKIVYSLFFSEDTTSGDVLVTYTEIERIREYLMSLNGKVSDEFIEKYLKKLYVLELELKKVHVMELEEEINEERGKGR